LRCLSIQRWQRVFSTLVSSICAKNNIDRDEWRVTDELLTIAALLSVPSLFNSVRDPTSIAKAKKKYGVIEGDHITLLNIYNLYQSKKSDNEKKGLCKELNLNEKSIQKAAKVQA
jgi:hypothetical protein